MENKIFVDITMFSTHQVLTLIKDNKKQEPILVTLNDLCSTILYYIEVENVNEVDFSGHKIFIDKIVDELSEDLKVTKYANRNVRILINGEVLN